MSSGKRRSFSPTVRELVRDAQHGVCDNCDENKIQDFHHRVSNSVTNNKLYPHFLHAPFNCVGLCRDCHDGASHYFNIQPDTAMAYETYLKLLVEGGL